MTLNQAVFLVLAVLAALGAIGVVAFGERPVRSALCLVVNFFVLALIYFGLGAQLLGISQIMVYAGAIMVLFLFVVMMLQLQSKSTDKLKPSDPKVALGWLVGFSLAALLATTIAVPMLGFKGSPVTDDFGKPQEIGKVLFTTYAWPFEVASVLLLIGVVGSILLAKRRI